MNNRLQKIRRALHYIGPVLLLALIFYVNPFKIAKRLVDADFRWLLVGLVLNLPQLGLKAYRWSLLVKWQGLNYSYPRAFLAYFSSLLVGFLTPGRLGEFVKAFSLKYETGATLARSLSSVVVDRVFDMYLLLTLGMLGLLRFTVVGTRLSTQTFIIICVLLAIPLLFLNSHITRASGHLFCRLPIIRKRSEGLKEKIDQFAEGLSVLTPGRILRCAGLTIAAYSVFFLQCYCCLWAIHVKGIPILDLVMLMAATNFISFIPISISGLGTREVCLVYFLSQVHPPQGEAVAVLYGLSLFLVLFLGGGLIGYFCWHWAPIGLRKAWKEEQQTKHPK